MNHWTPIQTDINQGRFETIDPGIIVRFKECQPRVDGTDPKVVAEYAMDMREYDATYKEQGVFGWQKFPRIACVKNEYGEHILYSGFHRHDAILQVGYETVEVYVYDGTRQDAILLSKGENANNGVRRTNADKAHVVKSCLLDDELKQWSNEQIAKWCGVAPPTVGNHEKTLQNFLSENGDLYTRPTRRKRLSKSGEIEWVETADIGNGKDKEIARIRSKAKEAETEMWRAFENTGLEGDYMDRDDFQEEVAKAYHYPVPFPDLSELKDPQEWIARFHTIKAALENQAGWVKDLLANYAEMKLDELDEELTAHYQEHQSWDGLSIDALSDGYLCAPSKIYTVMENVRKTFEKSELRKAQERANTRRKRMWSHVSSEIRTKGGIQPVDLSDKDIAKAAATSLGLGKIEVPRDDIAFDAYKFIMGDIESPPYSLSDCTLNDAAAWADRFDRIYDDIENRVEWVAELLKTEKPQSDTEKTQALEKFQTQKRDLYNRVRETPLAECKDEFGNVVFDKTFHQVMVAGYKQYDLDESLLYSDQAIEALSVDEIGSLTGHYYLMVQDFNPPGADWVQALSDELGAIPETDAESDDAEDEKNLEDQIERCRGDLTEVYQQAYTWEGLEIHLYAEEYGIDVDVIEAMQKEIAAEHSSPKPETDDDEGTSKPVNSLEIASEALSLTLDTLDIDEETMLEMFGKAATHYDFNVKHFLYVTDLFDVDEVEQAAAYCKALAPPHAQSWAQTISSVQRDIERRENWAKPFFNDDAPEEAEDVVDISGVNYITIGWDNDMMESFYAGESTYPGKRTLSELPLTVKQTLLEIARKSNENPN